MELPILTGIFEDDAQAIEFLQDKLNNSNILFDFVSDNDDTMIAVDKTGREITANVGEYGIATYKLYSLFNPDAEEDEQDERLILRTEISPIL